MKIMREFGELECSPFWGCDNLKSITFPSGLRSIEYRVFKTNPNITQVIIDDFYKYYGKEDKILFNADMTRLIQYPRNDEKSLYRIPETITVIESSAFSNCKKLEVLKISKN